MLIEKKTIFCQHRLGTKDKVKEMGARSRFSSLFLTEVGATPGRQHVPYLLPPVDTTVPPRGQQRQHLHPRSVVLIAVRETTRVRRLREETGRFLVELSLCFSRAYLGKVIILSLHS